MTLPEGWEWLDELPEEWSPPAELREPTRDVVLNLPIKMLSSEIIGNDIVELVGRLVAEKAQFSIWFAREAKVKAASSKDLALLSMVGLDQIRLVYEAWCGYVAAFESSGGAVGTYENERTSLTRALSEAISTLVEARNRLRAGPT